MPDTNKEHDPLFEDIKVELDCPYNTPLKHLFDTENWKIQVIKENGDVAVVRVRRKFDNN